MHCSYSRSIGPFVFGCAFGRFFSLAFVRPKNANTQPLAFYKTIKSRCESPCRGTSASLRCGPGPATTRRLGGRTPGAKHDPLTARVRSSVTADSTPCLSGRACPHQFVQLPVQPGWFHRPRGPCKASEKGSRIELHSATGLSAAHFPTALVESERGPWPVKHCSSLHRAL